MTKICSACGVEKPFDEFHRRWAQCKACRCARQRAYEQRTRAARNETRRRRRATPAAKLLLQAEQQRMRARYPEKARARGQVNDAVRRGKLTPQPCVRCGAVAEAHHEDYGKPLGVEWLCRTHHAAEHPW